MTTIATDGKTIAADSRSTTGTGAIMNSNAIKMFEGFSNHFFEKVIMGFGGTANVKDYVIRTLLDGHFPERGNLPEDADYTVLVITESGAAYTIASDTIDYEPVDLPCAIGTGDAYAIGAMLAGASPKEAVEIASKIDVYTGGEIQVMSFDD